MSALSNWVAARVNRKLDREAEARAAGWVFQEMAFILQDEPRILRRPDVAFVSHERWPADRPIPATGEWRFAPDLAVEVVSPNDNAYALNDKIIDYLRLGVREVWVVYPQRGQVTVHESMDLARTVVAPRGLETRLLPGWVLPLAEVFPAVAEG